MRVRPEITTGAGVWSLPTGLLLLFAVLASYWASRCGELSRTCPLAYQRSEAVSHAAPSGSRH